jgi:hypothetical protein
MILSLNINAKQFSMGSAAGFLGEQPQQPAQKRGRGGGGRQYCGLAPLILHHSAEGLHKIHAGKAQKPPHGNQRNGALLADLAQPGQGAVDAVHLGGQGFQPLTDAPFVLNGPRQLTHIRVCGGLAARMAQIGGLQPNLNGAQAHGLLLARGIGPAAQGG